MKKIINLMLLFLCASNYGQDDPRDGVHEFRYGIQLTECDFNGNAIVAPLTALVTDMQAGWSFKIINVVNSNTDYVIRVSKFKNDNALNLLTYQRTGSVTYIYYMLTGAQYDSYARRFKKRGSFIVGASTTIIKIRPGNNSDDANDKIYADFGNDVNLGVTAGWRIAPRKDKEVYLSIVGGLSFSSIKVTPQTTKNFLTTDANQSALTFSLGLIGEIEKFQLSGFVGIDAMSGAVAEHWIYRNRPWIGIGFGYSIFQVKAKDQNNP